MDVTTKLPDRKAVQADGLPVPRRYGAMLAMSIAIAVSVLDIAIANTALPTIAADLQASPAASVWVVNAYQLALVISLLPLAALGEIIGYRTIYMAGLALFTVASVACALSWSLPSLTAARVLQGFGASGIMSVNAALIRFIYPTRLLGRGIGFNTLIVAIFSALGPTVAAGILAVASWQWLFAVNLPLGIIALAVALPTLPYTARSTHRFDLVSAALNAGAFGLLIVAIGEGAHRASALEVGLELAGAVLFGALLVRRQAAHPAPLLPLDLFRRPIFALSALTAACSFATQGLAFVALPFYFQGTLGRTAVETGLLMTPWPVVVAIMAPIAGRLSDRYSAGVLGGIGLAILCLGMVLMALLPPEPSVLDICWRMALCGWGFGFFQAPNQKALLASAPAHRAGGASGIVAQARLLGQTIGAALVALCFGIAAVQGPALALAVGAGFAGLASIASFLRLLPSDPDQRPRRIDPIDLELSE
jgi:DHA2 family multidrug resistance protein-like MFS transporter